MFSDVMKSLWTLNLTISNIDKVAQCVGNFLKYSLPSTSLFSFCILEPIIWGWVTNTLVEPWKTHKFQIFCVESKLIVIGHEMHDSKLLATEKLEPLTAIEPNPSRSLFARAGGWMVRVCWSQSPLSHSQCHSHCIHSICKANKNVIFQSWLISSYMKSLLSQCLPIISLLWLKKQKVIKVGLPVGPPRTTMWLKEQ